MPSFEDHGRPWYKSKDEKKRKSSAAFSTSAVKEFFTLLEPWDETGWESEIFRWINSLYDSNIL